jgi:hypothetical protein
MSTIRRTRLLLGVLFVFAIQVALVPPVKACSCGGFTSMADYRGEDTAVFTGIVEPPDQRGFPATVTRWFHGGNPFQPRVWFEAAGFNGDGASCGIEPLPVGTQWIFVAYKAEGQETLGLGLCSPHARLPGAEGQAMLLDAARTFGGGGAPAGTDPPGAAASTSPAVSATQAPSAGAITDPLGLPLVPIVVVVVAAFGFIGGLVVVLRRLRR